MSKWIRHAGSELRRKIGNYTAIVSEKPYKEHIDYYWAIKEYEAEDLALNPIESFKILHEGICSSKDMAIMEATGVAQVLSKQDQERKPITTHKPTEGEEAIMEEHIDAMDMANRPEEAGQAYEQLVSKTSAWVKKAQDDAESGEQDPDRVNLLRNIDLEQDAINIYRGQMEHARPHIKKLLEHVIQEETNHMTMFEAQLSHLDSPLSEEEMRHHD